MSWLNTDENEAQREFFAYLAQRDEELRRARLAEYAEQIEARNETVRILGEMLDEEND